MTTHDSVKAILTELDEVLSRVTEAQIDALVDAILRARRILVFGLGVRGPGYAELHHPLDALGL